MKLLSRMVATLICAFGTVDAIAQARIAVDSTTRSVGQIYEGETQLVRATYTIRNTGTEPLRITQVRPGCRCTVAEYDSVIAPDQAGRLSQVIDVTEFHDGPFKRSTRVSSNAVNSPEISLSVVGIIRSQVEVGATELPVYSGAIDTTRPPVFLRVRQAGFAITDAELVPRAESRRPWDPALPIPLKVALVAQSKSDPEGYTYYELRLWTEYPVADLTAGMVYLRTNHPRKPLIVLHGGVPGTAAPAQSRAPPQ